MEKVSFGNVSNLNGSTSTLPTSRVGRIAGDFPTHRNHLIVWCSIRHTWKGYFGDPKAIWLGTELTLRFVTTIPTARNTLLANRNIMQRFSTCIFERGLRRTESYEKKEN